MSLKKGDKVIVNCPSDSQFHGMTGVLVKPLHGRNWSVQIDGYGPLAFGVSTLERFDDKPAPDPVSHPPHYVSHPSGIECIQVTEHMSFLLGNTIKYIWRADLKQDAIEDLKKARWYLNREIQKRETA